MKKNFLVYGLVLSGVLLSAAPVAQHVFSTETGFRWEDGVLHGSVPEMPEGVRFFKKGIRTDFPADPYAGKLVEFSAEGRWINQPASGGVKRGYIQFAILKKDGKTLWDGIYLTPDQKNWTSFKKILRLPDDLKALRVFLGFENACGHFELRKLNLTILGAPLNFSAYGNRTLRDRVSGDGRGGWTDQGPDSDGRVFEPFFRAGRIGEVPFSIPVRDQEAKTVLVMRSRRNPNGILEQEIPVVPTRANHLYVLQTLSYAGENGTPAGRILVRTESGMETELPVVTGRDLGDWWNGKPVSDGSDFIRVNGTRASHVLYLTRYDLPQSKQKITSVRFISDNEDSIWILCGATLTEQKYPLPSRPEKKPLTIRANAEWQPAIRTATYPFRKKGSILDVTPYTEYEPITEENRLLIRGRHFYRKNDPSRPVRFFCATARIHLGFPKSLETREKIREYVEEMKVRGYNMIQIYSSAVMKDFFKTGKFNETALELYDFFFDLCRKNGIYVDFILMPRDSGFYPFREQWGNPPWPFGEDEVNVSFGIYFSDEHRKNWEDGVTTLLNRRNRFNGTLWKEDPAILLYGADNEQEYAFNFKNIRPKDQLLAVGPYRSFLKNRYKSIEAYNRKWNKNFRAFEEIPCFNIKEKNSDVNDFLYEKSVDLIRWEKSVLKKIGAKGYLGETMNFVKTLTYHFIRREFDFISMHIYHDHPLGNHSGRGGYNRQTSAIRQGNQFFRTLAGSRHYNKPLICSEYDQPFWNRYRYERSFVIGAYAAFNDIDGLTVWGEPCRKLDLTNTRRESWLTSAMKAFTQAADPLADASQILSYFMFMRGDVRPAEKFVRIVADKPSVFRTNPLAAPAPEQTALSLLLGYAQESVDDPAQIAPAGKNELLIPSLGGGKMRIEGYFTEAVGATRNISGTINTLKEKGFLPENNRSNGENIFENATGELYLDTERLFMTVNTPRLQGMCAPAGERAELADVQILSHNRDGNLTVAAVDGLKPIREAKRLLLVRLTNALNSGMVFTDDSMTQLESLGHIPALLQNSTFRFRIRSRYAKDLKLYPLSLEGIRTGKVLSPVAFDGNSATFSVDTAKDGNTVYFEISAKTSAGKLREISSGIGRPDDSIRNK